MADQKISELTAATSIDGTEQLPILQAGANKRYSLNGVLFDKEVVSFDGTNFRDKSENIITITGDGLVLQDLLDADFVRVDVNGDLIDGSSAVISGTATAATVAALPAAAGASGDVYLALDPGNNGSTVSAPAACYSNGTKWVYEGLVKTIAQACEELRFTAPAATWDDTGVFTMATADAGASTQITSGGGVHGITSTGKYINIISGTGWTPGVYRISVIDSTTALTINHPYAGGLGQPVFSYAGGAAYVGKRWKLPPLSTSGYAEVVLTVDHTHAVTDSTEFNVEHVASGGAVGAGYTIYDQGPETTNAPIYRASIGFSNFGATNVQKTLMAKADPDGWGSSNAGAVETGAIQTNVATDLIATFAIATADDDIKLSSWRLLNAL